MNTYYLVYRAPAGQLYSMLVCASDEEGARTIAYESDIDRGRMYETESNTPPWLDEKTSKIYKFRGAPIKWSPGVVISGFTEECHGL